MKNDLSLSTQTFGINASSRPERKKHCICALWISSVLLAILAGFLIGYFVDKSKDDSAGDGKVSDTVSRTFQLEQLLSTLDSKLIENISRSFSSQPHIAASRRNLELASEIQQRWKDFGFDDVSLSTYEVLLSYPKPNTTNKAEIINQTGEVVYTSLPHYDDDGVPVFLAYSSSGVVEGELVYVNYATQNDFEELSKRNVSLKGKIAIARYGQIFRGSKVAMASRHGAIGVLLYPDPVNFAPFDQYYPESWWLPPNATQRGSVYPGPSFGDPLTHGLPATPGMFRSARDHANLPKIPVHALTYGEAEHFLSRMAGPVVPRDWKGGLNITYRFGPGFNVTTTKVRLNVTTENVIRNITNVIGTVNGSVEPDRIVLIGAHRDSWVYGAVDPVSATAIVMELARAVGVLLKTDWRPRRTIKFCSWSAEEFALIGSTEWVEENSRMLSERAVAYLNMDLAVCGNFTLRTYSSPLFNQLILDGTRNVTDPTASDSSHTLYDVMVEREPSPGGMDPTLKTLGTFSDYASFYQYIGVPSLDWGYYFADNDTQVFPYPVYHSSVETFEWLKKFVDPDFKIHLAVAKLGGIFLMRLADSPLLPMNSVSAYTRILRHSVGVLRISQNSIVNQLLGNISLVYLEKAIEDFDVAAKLFQEYLRQYENINDFTKLRILNDQIREIEKAFLYSNGLPGRNEFKHLIFAPSLHNTYASANFPGITDALYECEANNMTDCKNARLHVSIATHAIRQAAAILRPIL